MRKFLNYINKEIWEVRTETLPKWKACWIRFLRLALIVSHGFTKSQIQQGASTLTYYTLLAIVPLLALIVGIARGFLLEDQLQRWLVSAFQEQRQIITQIINFANASLQHAQGAIAGIGLIILLWAGIKILINIEAIMNTIWEVKANRSWARRFSDYLAMIFLCPFFLLLASGITGYLSAAIQAFAKEGTFFQDVGPFLFLLLNVIPFLLTWILLTFLYIFMPNTRVRFRPALYAGIITGTVYLVIQWIYLKFQIGVTSYNAIYGTFAALPLFLIWIHLSWVIVLLGAKISFAIQNVDAYGFISEDIHLSHRLRTILSLRISHLCIKYFCRGDLAPSLTEISNVLSIPLLLTSNLVYRLIDADVLSEVKRDTDKDSGFHPAMNPDKLTIKRVLDMINSRGEEIALPGTPELEAILKSLTEFSDLIERSNANIPLKNI